MKLNDSTRAVVVVLHSKTGAITPVPRTLIEFCDVNKCKQLCYLLTETFPNAKMKPLILPYTTCLNLLFREKQLQSKTIHVN